MTLARNLILHLLFVAVNRENNLYGKFVKQDRSRRGFNSMQPLRPNNIRQFEFYLHVDVFWAIMDNRMFQVDTLTLSLGD